MKDNYSNSEKRECHDQERRINQLRAELDQLASGKMEEGDLEDCPPDIKEQFLKQVLEFERSDRIALQDVLAKDGYRFPAPDDLSDQDLIITMWELIDALAEIRVFLECTNHLSDRALYSCLWHKSLREEDVFEPVDPASAWHFDMTGVGEEDEISVYLKYYADEIFRKSWEAEFPNDPMPPAEDPPHDRDRHLPKAWVSD